MKKFLRCFVLVSLMFLACKENTSSDPNNDNGDKEQYIPRGYPRLAVYWQNPKDFPEKVVNFNLLIIDAEHQKNSYDDLDGLKQLNAKLKIVAYWNIMEIHDPMTNGRHFQSQAKSYIDQHPKYNLYDPDGNWIYYWQNPKSRMLNLSISCPKVDGKIYAEWIAGFLLQNIFQDKIWDGIFADNCWQTVSWIGNLGYYIDLDRNGKADNPNGWQPDLLCDSLWRAGIKCFLQVIRSSKGEDFLIIGNELNLYYLDLCDGKMAENSPPDYIGNWKKLLDQLLESKLEFNVLHVGAHSVIALVIAILTDSYYCLGYNYASWKPEYKDLGEPISNILVIKEGVLGRNFEKGAVLANLGTSSRTIDLGVEYLTLDDKKITTVTLDSDQAILLYGRKGSLSGSD